ncbi:hypothetical protein SLS62_007967 [Diatrype stigma]|uniref:F-box domain-containing protein n=1 Tax=Diatrype stigma TaxID=117547 RepID=A0AAN9UKQ2_9PEZI
MDAPDAPSDQIQSELENFRKEWQAEVSARVKNPHPGNQAGPSSSVPSSSSKPPPRRSESSTHKRSVPSTRARDQVDGENEDEDEDDHYAPPRRSLDGGEPEPTTGHRLGGGGGGGDDESKGKDKDKDKSKPPQTALDFYEAAVEKETTGKLGDSLQLYRRAFRMDSDVDSAYKSKYFPSAWRAKPPPPSSASATTGQTKPAPSAAPAPAPASAPAPVPAEGSAIATATATATATAPAPPAPSLADLIGSFAGTTIQGVPPEVEGMPPPPCPIAALPDEILVHLLRDVAVADVADFVRLARVCRRLAYLVATEDQIWRRVCLGAEFGFGGMHYRFQQGVTWEPLSPLSSGADEAGVVVLGTAVSEEEEQEQQRAAAEAEAAAMAATSVLLLHGVYRSSWCSMFRSRPRVRFNGCYISTVNYIRAGQASGHQITWNSPVHIVTYYRYLRLFRDGAAISLLTTEEPAHVVPHLTREALALHRSQNQHHQHHRGVGGIGAGGGGGGGGGPSHLPSAVIAQALRGRWRLSGASSEGAGGSGSGGIGSDGVDSGHHGDVATAAAAAAAAAAEDGRKKKKNKAAAEEDRANSLASLEGDLFIETEGVGSKYIYRMDLALRNGSSRGGATRSNKLVWKGFWSYNKLTDDWAEFGLTNDKPFFFSRVKSYGHGLGGA